MPLYSTVLIIDQLMIDYCMDYFTVVIYVALNSDTRGDRRLCCTLRTTKEEAGGGAFVKLLVACISLFSCIVPFLSLKCRKMKMQTFSVHL